jgi:hypothetical protein
MEHIALDKVAGFLTRVLAILLLSTNALTHNKAIIPNPSCISAWKQLDIHLGCRKINGVFIQGKLATSSTHRSNNRVL